MRSLITAALLVSSSFLYAEEATTLKQQLNASPDLLIIAEEGSASALYYGSEDMPLSTIGAMDRSCQGIGGVGIIGKQSVGALASELPNNESAQAYMNIFKNYPEKGVAIYNGWFRCIADKGSFAVKKQSQLPLLIIEENIASAHFEAFDNYKSFANENNSAFARLVDAAADCKADRGRGVIVGDFNGKIPVPVSSLFMATANGDFRASDFEQGALKLLCPDTKKKNDAFTSSISKINGKWEHLPMPGVNVASLSGEVRNTATFSERPNPQKTDGFVKGQDADMFHTPARLKTELEVAGQAFNAKSTVLAHKNGREYEGVYMGMSGSCELAAVFNAPVTPLGMKDVYRDNKTIGHIENFKKCGTIVAYNGQTYNTDMPVDLKTDVDRAYSMCKLNGTSSVTYNGYSVSCSTKGNDASRIYEFTVVRNEKLVSRFYSK